MDWGGQTILWVWYEVDSICIMKDWVNFNVHNDEYNAICIYRLTDPERRRYLRDENDLLNTQKQNLLDITSFIATPLNRCHRQLLRLKLHVVIPAAHPEWTVPYPQWEDGINPTRTIPRPRWVRD